MAEKYPGLGNVPEPLRDNIQHYAALVEELAGSSARALTLFGAIAAGTFDARRHSIRSVLVVEPIDLNLLCRLAERGVKLGKAFIAAPLVMTPAYIDESRDTFPLELIEIQQKHITLFGKDYFSQLEFDAQHVRLQCERELKVQALGLRQGLLAAAGREKPLADLELTVGENLLRTLRGMLWLKDRRDAQPAASVVNEIENLLQRKLPGVRAAIDPSAAHGWEQYKNLYNDVIALGDAVNAW